jgi:hypothetical protein
LNFTKKSEIPIDKIKGSRAVAWLSSFIAIVGAISIIGLLSVEGGSSVIGALIGIIFFIANGLCLLLNTLYRRLVRGGPDWIVPAIFSQITLFIGLAI